MWSHILFRKPCLARWKVYQLRWRTICPLPTFFQTLQLLEHVLKWTRFTYIDYHQIQVTTSWMVRIAIWMKMALVSLVTERPWKDHIFLLEWHQYNLHAQNKRTRQASRFLKEQDKPKWYTKVHDELDHFYFTSLMSAMVREDVATSSHIDHTLQPPSWFHESPWSLNTRQ